MGGHPSWAYRLRPVLMPGPLSSLVVLRFPVGRARPPVHGFWLTVASFTFYRFYWDVKAHEELWTQFELGRERRATGFFWYMLGFILVFLRFVYYGYFVGNVEYLRARFGMQPGIRTATFLTLTIIGTSALYLLPTVGILLSMYVGAEFEEPYNLADWIGIGLVVAGIAVNLTFYVIAYVRLQRSINQVWAAFHGRIAQLAAGPTSGQPDPPRTSWHADPTLEWTEVRTPMSPR